MENQKSFSALDALDQAHDISIAPFVFQASSCLLQFGILALLDQHFDRGCTLFEIETVSGLNRDSLETLMQFALEIRLVEKKEDRYALTKTGWFLLHDPLVKVNFAFTRDVCYQGLKHLKESLEKNAPVGLRALGDWPEKTIYPVLTKLPEDARKSWFDFDHFYSDKAFQDVGAFILKEFKPRVIADVGGNTGRFSVLYCGLDPEAEINILDLPQQCRAADRVLAAKGLSKRVRTCAIDVIQDAFFPALEADVWLMSQFLDCFDKRQIVAILQKIKAAAKPGAKVLILEPFVGNQRFKTADRCLAALSLYFTAIANGTSRFYTETELLQCVKEAGFIAEKTVNHLGTGHTLLVCSSSTDANAVSSDADRPSQATKGLTCMR